MLSGNGRHRRPRQAPALVVAAGVTGSAIAIPLLAASGANAASTTTWDKLAECESGGQWSLDAGNGYYGGLQLSQETWEQYGGLDYAPSADEASRSQQIAVAEKALQAKGPSVWPSCSIVAGLTQSGDAADVDPGASTSPRPSTDSAESPGVSDSTGTPESPDVTSSPETSVTSDASASSKASGSAREKSHQGSGASGRSGASDGSGSSEDAATPDAPAASDAPSADATTDTPGNQASDEPSATAEEDNSGKSGQSDATSALGEDASSAGRHRGERAADDASASRGSEGRHASREEARSGSAYTVRSGDNLSDIADAQNVDGGWNALYDLNKETVGSDPDLILPGQSLNLGSESGEDQP
ncbi:transglycosylase family protein [Streptomyces sp. NPDC046939]|uniref:transglycosylase family protein n=1 Tax=Streptomyces sp. NPDC046939 TaxID=3155376 RepID=UPI0033FB9439